MYAFPGGLISMDHPFAVLHPQGTNKRDKLQSNANCDQNVVRDDIPIGLENVTEIGKKIPPESPEKRPPDFYRCQKKRFAANRNGFTGAVNKHRPERVFRIPPQRVGASQKE